LYIITDIVPVAVRGQLLLACAQVGRRYEDLMPAYFPLAQEERKVATEFVWPWGGYRVEVPFIALLVAVSVAAVPVICVVHSARKE
jgi:hypothetical protein